MRILHLADLHLSSKHPERAGWVRKMLWEKVLEHNKFDCVVIAGDVYDDWHGSDPEEREDAFELLNWLTGLAQTMVIRGNHDRLGDLDLICQYAEATYKEMIGRFLGEFPGFVALPHVVMPLTKHEGTAKEVVLEMLHTMVANAKENTDGPIILVGHVELTGTTKAQQTIGPAMKLELSADDLLALGCDYYALGHIHDPMIIDDKICYAGAPYMMHYGESQVKGCCIVEVERGQKPIITRIQSDAPLMLTTELGVVPAGIAGNSVRIKYECDESESAAKMREAKDQERAMLEAGACAVKIDPRVRPVARVRAATISQARTNADRLKAFWAANEMPIDERCLAALDGLETENDN